MAEHITAVCPAEGWFAMYGHEEEPWLTFNRVAVFAAGRFLERGGPNNYEDEGVRGYIPCDGYLMSPEQDENFLKYIHASDLADSELIAAWRQQAQQHAEFKKRQAAKKAATP